MLFGAMLLGLASCNWYKDKPEVATKFGDHYKNKIYYDFDTAVYKRVFQKILQGQVGQLSNPNVVKAFYAGQQNMPVLATRFLIEGQLDSLLYHLKKSGSDGFNPRIFKSLQIDSGLKAFKANQFKQINEVYPLLAKLELCAAEGLLKYYIFNHFGAINPRNYYNRFYIKVKRPDSLGMLQILGTDNIPKTLAQAEKHTKLYNDLKRQLAVMNQQKANDLAVAIIKLNMERMRWQMPIQSSETVLVNIPDFSLTWFKGDDTLTTMKVCVGAKREKTYAEKMKVFMRTGKLDDKPKNHETPQLMSMFDAIQVNPIWNIPVSIAKSEIYWMARKDPYYLSNNNIKVYHKGQLVADPDTINWNNYTRDKLPFKFKQGSGEGNALGKFKFVFNSSSSIYLHDTNNKYAFNLANRAISHGCVRVENPLAFAELLVGNAYQYDNLRMDVDLPPVDTTRNAVFAKKLAKKRDTAVVYKLKPTWFAPRKNIRVWIGYFTAWANAGKMEFRPDVYDYDPILQKALNKYQ